MQVIDLQKTELTADTRDIIYNSLDTLNTFALYDHFNKTIPAWGKAVGRYSEKMLGPVLTMMRRGILIDTKARDEVVAELEERRVKVRQTFDTICEGVVGTDINLNSDQQLKWLFYSALAIPEVISTKKGENKVTTDRGALEKIAKEYARGKPFALLILRVRDLEKQIEMLSKGLSETNRFHSSYNLAGTDTFRLSSSEHPFRIGSNAQNVNPNARRIFVPDPGYVMFQADQQGAESRLVSYLTGDENYIKACEGGDAHTMVASMVFGFEPIRDLAEREYMRGKSYRQFAKVGSHSCNYMVGPNTLAKNLGIDLDTAQQFQTVYYKRFPKIAAWHQWVAKQLQEKGWLQSPLGMKRVFWDRRWDNSTLRQAVAFGPQSTVGVLTNMSIHNLWERFEGKPGAPVQVLANVHDGIVGQVRADMADELWPQIIDCITIPFEVEDISGKRRTITIPYDLEVGGNWDKRSEINSSGLIKWKRKI